MKERQKVVDDLNEKAFGVEVVAKGSDYPKFQKNKQLSWWK